jgi:hypothetical protein
MRNQRFYDRLMKVNKKLLYMREICTQVGVLQEIDELISDVCRLEDDLCPCMAKINKEAGHD